MFSINLRQSVRLCNKIFTRDLRNRNRLGAGGANPGLDHRISAFKNEGMQIEHNAEEFLEESESDFYKVGSSYKAHIKESKASKEQLKHLIVKEKYFKDIMPNLLTWSEKEQIRHLATTNPKEWTPERISESFPVTVPIVKKLLKYPWKPASDKRIARHDANAIRNWKELKEGTLNIPEQIKQQMLKFSERVIPPLKTESVKIDLTIDNKIGEFEEIILRCAANKTDHTTNTRQSTSHSEKSAQDDVHYKSKQNTHHMTLGELTTDIKNRIKEGDNINMPDQLIVDTINTDIIEDLKDVSSENILTEHKNIENEVAVKKPDNKTVSPINYPERIRIPKQAYKKGATYKVNDCFYDHDGKFLYRVLGIKN